VEFASSCGTCCISSSQRLCPAWPEQGFVFIFISNLCSRRFHLSWDVILLAVAKTHQWFTCWMTSTFPHCVFGGYQEFVCLMASGCCSSSPSPLQNGVPWGTLPFLVCYEPCIRAVFRFVMDGEWNVVSRPGSCPVRGCARATIVAFLVCRTVVEAEMMDDTFRFS
jgi:hypothetical protein